MPKLSPGKLVIASHNPGKVREIRALLQPYGVEAVSAASLDLPEPEETGTTFAANALLKARQAADLSGLPALSDDSGLCVEALGGDPGIFSARWAGPTKDFGAAMRAVEEAIARLPDASRSAHFVCALALCWPDGSEVEVEGRVDGSLIWPPRRCVCKAGGSGVLILISPDAGGITSVPSRSNSRLADTGTPDNRPSHSRRSRNRPRAWSAR